MSEAAVRLLDRPPRRIVRIATRLWLAARAAALSRLAVALQGVGIAAFAYGFWLLAHWAGFVALGVLLMTLGIARELGS